MSTSDPQKLAEMAKSQTQANRYAFLRKTSYKQLIQRTIKTS
jgi:hypothetical protein